MNAKTYSPIVDLRMYTHQPNKRNEFIRLFEREFIETQEAVGIQVLGQFYDLDEPNRCIWLRGFNDMSARAQSLNAFYSGPIWKTHRDATNATLIDTDNVLLLRLVHPTSGFSLKIGERPPQGTTKVRKGLMTANIYYFNSPVKPDFINYFENTMHPELMDIDTSVLAYFVTEDSPNTYPRLPVREGVYVFVWFAGFLNQGEYKSHLARLEKSKLWNGEIAKFLKKHLNGKPEILRLAPTPRSWLTGMA